MPFPNEHSCRLNPPGRYEEFGRVSRSTHDTHKEYSVIRGKKADGTWEDQAFRYPKDRWSADQARQHCSAHDGSFEAASPQANEDGRVLHRNSIVCQSAIPIRREMFEGKNHIVVPVVALVEGVHYGNGGPFFYPAVEIAKYVASWNGIPIPVFHPEEYGKNVSANSPSVIEERSVGRFFNAFFDSDGGKLKGELWIDEDKAKKISPDILSLIFGGRPLEVSTALWSDDDATPGTWHDEEFVATVMNFRPDHIALLPGGEGACSWADGCGVRANKQNQKKVVQDSPHVVQNSPQGGEDMKTSVPGKIKILLAQIGNALGLISNELSHEDLRSKIQGVLDGLDNQGWIHFVRTIYDNFVVYEARGNNPNEGIVTPGQGKLYKRGYTVDDQDNVTLTSDAQEVREEINYIPVVNDSVKVLKPDKKVNLNQEVCKMKKDELIQALIACDKTRFKEEDKEWLGTMSVEQLEKLKAMDPPKAPEPKVNQPEPKKEDPKMDPAKKPVTVEEFIGNAPPEIQSVLTRAVNRDKAIKGKLVEELMKNERNTFSREQLETKDIGELESLATLAHIEMDFSGQGGGPASNEDKDAVPPMPPVFEMKAT